ncbi:MAG: 2-oxoacid:acceptor oxidoreductase family protein [Bacteriovoracaceae bacterium]|nr:2-oxoacid:acceptor oxidoreductase family protein [Bacteriovoracaceae bacterium]
MGKILQKPTGFYDKFVRKPGTYDQVTHYCPGCGHGRIHKLIAEAMQNLEIGDQTVFISPVGCSVFAYYYFDCGNIQSAHGRAPAVGTGVARSNPHAITISYQGDGDLGAIGTSEIIHAANRGERMTIIFVNNGIYGMTGGQMAPTTLPGQITSTTPYGRDAATTGLPMKMCEIISQLDAPVYVERTAVTDAKGIMKTKRAITKALKSQKEGYGFSFVEILSACPIGWKMSANDSIKRIEEEMIPYFPLKTFKDEIADRTPRPVVPVAPSQEDVLKALGHDQKEEILFKNDKKFIDDFTTQKVRIAGFGGQGVLMAGTTLGMLGMELGLDVTWLPSYGPEMRGGTANCHVVLSNKEVGSPVVESPNVLIAMNEPSLVEFEPSVTPGGLVIVNSSVVVGKCKRSDVTVLEIPMTEIADSCGLKAAANMASISAYLAFSKVIEKDQLVTLIKAKFKKKSLIEQNVAVIEAAYKYVSDHVRG